ncbi:beta-lactamase family protein [Clostridium sp. FP2]|uniref:serine hydrolase domain-containing protein n=1 Tax=Clostridium sp. FP2 TaxID=2724481 RepID=UPI0013E963F6|nr:serine hydrolase domain-containing protein [Clostridium sp. FP2]MBZ9624196.1 beta-lactamase family protein [Clostridium sp. FP2]
MLKVKNYRLKGFKFITLIFTICFFVFSNRVFAFDSVNKDPQKNISIKIDEYMNEQVKQGRFSGSVLVAQKGKILISKGYGTANYELNVPNTPKTIFRIGSITKQFTALAILQLQEQGKIKVEDTINKYIPDYPQGDKITIHQLLTHTSGIFNYTQILDFKIKCRLHYSPEELVATFKDKSSNFEPGKKFLYNNSGYILLGHIIEKISGKSYEDYINENIFKKAGLSNSGYDHSEKVMPNRAMGYGVASSAIVNCDFIDTSFPYAAGSLYSTVEDLYKWDKILLNTKIISKNSWDKMIHSYVNVGDMGTNTSYGYGLFVGDTQIGDIKKNTISHGGNVNGFAAYNCMYTSDDVQIIILSNLEFASPMDLNNDLTKIIFNQKLDVPKAMIVDPKIYNNYTGEYKIESIGESISIVKENNSIFADFGGTYKCEIYQTYEANDKSIYLCKFLPYKLIFYKDSNGKAIKIDIILGGESYSGNKVK